MVSRFQSAPLTEARGDLRVLCQLVLGSNVSIRSPHRSEGRRKCWNRILVSFEVSIRSPHRSEGRLTVSPNRTSICSVSIRSPHRSEGRQPDSLPNDTVYWFQSAPLTEARGDRSLHSERKNHIMFQSAPLTEARGDPTGGGSPGRHHRFNPLPSPKRGETLNKMQGTALGIVSIRSPHRSEGRHACIVNIFFNRLFQSAPLTEARGDRVALIEPQGIISFNPLPSPKRGETWF